MREAFLIGCGLAPGGEALLEEGLHRVGTEYAWADPSKHLANAKPRVAIVHGRDDDVIPYFEAYKIRAALPAGHPHELHLTGMYGHTGSSLPSPRAAFSEVATLVRVLRVLSRESFRRELHVRRLRRLNVGSAARARRVDRLRPASRSRVDASVLAQILRDRRHPFAHLLHDQRGTAHRRKRRNERRAIAGWM
jgi:hypothetical protein